MVATKTVPSWEQGTRRPSGAALRMLQILHRPETIAPLVNFRKFNDKRKHAGNRRGISTAG
ncbi:MAG: hypothetical protein BWZ08_00133 [candidate division BRC1 bacterium ADurb.BinA292]|nr:MAG: hypothetical protein BWZ08_00133 [candidate division BRC1 bacterium ADurb.BinA292]